jgi:FixJ family two-component response regulator
VAPANQEFRRFSVAVNVSPTSTGRDVHLTPREREVLAEILCGLSSKQIARGLAISPRTVEFHRAHLLQKHGAKKTADLVRTALANSATSVGTTARRV